MKKLLMYLVVISITFSAFAQSPNKMSYQAVIRNASGVLVTNQAVGMKISILQGSASGTLVFSETYFPNPQTNANGLLSIEIGSGSAISGTFSNILWGSGTYFLKTESDPTGGTNYTIVGTSQLLSVPYAMYAKTAGNGFSGNYYDLTNKPTLFSGNYNDLTNKPILFDGTWGNITGKPTTLTGYGITDGMSTSHVSNGITSNMITNWNTAYGWGNHSGLYKPNSYVPTWVEITSKPTFAAVATSGSYSDLLNRPVLFDGTWASLSGKPTFAAVATSGTFTDLLAKPTTLAGYGITDAMSTSHAANGITAANIANWTSAFSWGNHSGLYRPITYVPAWSEITSKPTSVDGYGITDAVIITGNQTITGIKTFSNDLLVNGLTIGKGNDAITGNTAIGEGALKNNTTGNFNTANGYYALYANTTGNYNTANGARALYSNTTAYWNTANGASALYSNTTGYGNTANGEAALYRNTEGYYNTANGNGALYSNTTGNYNTANGNEALGANKTGIYNTANGSHALYYNTEGNYNTANGYQALIWNTTGSFNTANGFQTLVSNKTGSNNTAIGCAADVALENLTNATAIGYGAVVDASNKVRIGNSAVTVIEGQVNWSVGSDRRLKDNIEYSNRLGLEFVNGLKTATFTYKNDSTKRHHDGLIAQDVIETLHQLGLKFSGIVESDNEEKMSNLSYAEFVIPLINAVQEQQKQIEELKQMVKSLMQK